MASPHPSPFTVSCFTLRNLGRLIETMWGSTVRNPSGFFEGDNLLLFLAHFGIFFFFFSLAVAFSSVLNFLAAFISFGAVVRRCFICVATKGGAGFESQEAESVGTGSNSNFSLGSSRNPIYMGMQFIQQVLSNIDGRLTSMARTATLRIQSARARVSSAPFGRGINLRYSLGLVEL